MSHVTRALWVVVIALLTACGPKTDNSRVHLAPPTESTTVSAGDIFSIQIVGEKDLPNRFQIDSSGYLDLPYIHRVHVDGMEPQEVAELIRKMYIEAKVLTDPSIVVRVEEYRSKHLVVLGQVEKPGRYLFTPGITLLQAISLAGGFNSTAKSDRITLTRKTKTGTQSAIVSADSITDGKSPDIPLQSDDRIFVPQRIF
jgi:polysaccharide export outer membrane protein